MLGREKGLCRGQGGHMHLFSRERLAASCGIVGSSAPLAAGFALAAKRLRPRSLAVAFFGDGAANQGMLLESLNLAVAWKLPALFVCKNNRWAITTRTEGVTGGDLVERARALSLHSQQVDGGDAMAVFEAVGRLVERIRHTGEPAFLVASCPRLDGHFLGDHMVGVARHPLTEGKEILAEVLTAAAALGGGGVGQRAVSLARLTNSLRLARGGARGDDIDPLERARRALKRRESEVVAVDAQVAEQMANVADIALKETR
jgi:hypothetical protein